MSKKYLVVTFGATILIAVSCNNSALVTQQSAATSLPHISPAQDRTTNWNTYRNEKYGFEFKYPGHWFIEDNKSFNTGRSFIVSNYKNSESFTKGNAPRDLLYYFVNIDSKSTSDTGSEEIKYANEKKQYNIGNGSQITVYIISKKTEQFSEVWDMVLPVTAAVVAGNGMEYRIWNPSEPITGGQQAQQTLRDIIETSAKSFKFTR